MPGFPIVIVGAGSAGCALAARLTEDPSCEVLLVEAGSDYWPGDVFPDLADGLHGPSIVATHDWGLSGCAGVDGRTIEVPRGRVIGGTSAINAAFMLRGSVHDYDGWAAAGNPGWSHADLLPSLCRLEHDLDFGDAAHHGADGPIPVHRRLGQQPTPWGEAVSLALTGIGIPAVDDLNAPGAVGVGRLPANTRDGRRISTAIGYLDPVRSRPNLRVLADTVVDRVRVTDGRADGVVLATGAVIDADEVILAAGAFLSPAILLRSGIGAASDLRGIGCDVVTDLPGVGRNLADHPAISIDLPYLPPWQDQPFFDFIATVHSPFADISTSSPDLQILTGGPFPQDDGTAVGFLAAAVVKPVSRGSVRLASSDPTAAPVIDLGYFRSEPDLTRMLHGLDLIESAIAQSSIVSLTGGARITGRMRDDPDGRAAALAATWTYFHPVGTCAMGPDPSAGAVVDTRCRVYGVLGLSVVDASVMPDIVAAPTNLTTIAIAERYVDLRRQPVVPASREEPEPAAMNPPADGRLQVQDRS